MGTKQNYLVVGCGFAGATVAYELAKLNYKVDIIDSRNHIAGNAYDYINENNIRIHKYGAHIFHTSNEKVYNWVKQFSDFVDYKHRVFAMLSNGETVIFPPTKDYVDKHGIDKIIETFYIPYTKKMWGTDWLNIDKSIIDRVPIRKDNDDLYFPNHKFQGLPIDGYTKLFLKILDNKNINVKLNTPYSKDMEYNYTHIFNSMPIDEYYDYCYGELPYRSIKFVNYTLPCSYLFNNSVINFTHNGPETRVIEWKHFPNHGVNENKTTITYEVPCDYRDNNNERYYPVKDINGQNKKIYNTYKNIPNNKVTFIGRCGQYVYIDMDQTISSSLNLLQNYFKRI